MTERGLVSVIIPAFNAQEFIEECLLSINAQTYTRIEAIVVDDGSNDLTPRLVERLNDSTQIPIQLIQQQNSGVSVARNRGAAVARGEFLAFLDADDAWLPDKVRRQLNVLEQRDGSIGVMCAYALFEHSKNRIIGKVQPTSNERFFRNWLTLQGPGPLLPSTLLMTRAAWDQSGGFSEELSTAADLDFGMKLLQLGKLEVIDEVLVRYRLTHGQMHRNPDALRRDFEVIMNVEYLVSNRSLRVQTAGNLRLHLAHKKWLAAPSVMNTLRLVGTCVRYPIQTFKRAIRRANRKRSLADCEELL